MGTARSLPYRGLCLGGFCLDKSLFRRVSVRETSTPREQNAWQTGVKLLSSFAGGNNHQVKILSLDIYRFVSSYLVQTMFEDIVYLVILHCNIVTDTVQETSQIILLEYLYFWIHYINKRIIVLSMDDCSRERRSQSSIQLRVVYLTVNIIVSKCNTDLKRVTRDNII